MSYFGDDIADNILDNDLNDHINDNELPGSDDDDEQNKDANDSLDKPKPVEPKKRAVRNPRHILKVETLKGPRGIHTIEKYFESIKYKGKGHEKQDLNEVMRRLQHWAHRMFSTYSFDDVLSKIERFGKKKELQVFMTRYRLGQLEGELIEKVDENENDKEYPMQETPFDEFDALLDEQIAISKLAPKTPSSASISSSTFFTPKLNANNAVMSTPFSKDYYDDLENLAQPLPSTPVSSKQNSPKKLTVEQMAKIAENRRIAMERLKLKKESQAGY